ncbi:hypothetical protein BDR26DRAFT_291323 [Obelidium mucronatum]|nr:hypothetical protein BDR26DRAFT_291323 [Obelidium mucronatum]
MVLRSHLGQYTEIHSTSEILALKSKRNPKTRGWIIDRMVESIRRQENTKQIVWLRGEAGTGKSVIAGCVADELETKGLLGASFFCQHDNKLRDNVSAMIQTISYELAKKDAEFRKRLLISLEDSKFRDKSHPSIQDLVNIFIINPFQDWSSTDPCAIILDALDELEDHSHVAAVLDAFQSLHHSVKLFLTSRHDVVVSVRGKKSYDIELFDVESQANKADIRVFTRDRLVEIAESFGDIQV